MGEDGGRGGSEFMTDLRDILQSVRQCVLPSGEQTGPSLLESTNTTVLNNMKLNHMCKSPDLFVKTRYAVSIA